MNDQVGEEHYICRYCDKPLYSARSLQIHEDRHTENLKFQCNYCDKTFSNLNSLTRHEETHSGEKDYLCPFCELGFHEKDNLVTHITKMHSIQLSSSDIQSTEEKKTFLTSMETIKTSQTKPVTQQIRNFPVTSSKSENYVSTTTRAEGSKEARFQCGYCDKSFATPSKVKRHILTHTGEKPFVCQFCQRGFSQKVHMMEHISKHHADESLKAQQEAAAAAAAAAAVAQAAAPAPLIKTLPSNKTLYATQTIATSPLINSSQSQQLRLHSSQTITTAQVMADTTAVQIPIPGNSYIVAEFSIKPEPKYSPSHDEVDTTDSQEDCKNDLMASMSHHNLDFGSLTKGGEGPFLSAASNYQAAVSQSNERPFVCPHCSADFIRQSNLSVHMMKVHGEMVEVRTHQCGYCDKKFKYPNKKRLHEMTHTGEKPNVCQFCTMGFFKKSRLRAHLTKVHGIPEDEVNSPSSSFLQNPTSTTHTIIQKTVTLSNGSSEHYCQYCQKPFSNRTDLLLHERQEAMEFEQLHDMFEDTEFTGLEVGNGQTDIIQNALLTAGIENGLCSPSVTDSDSVVTISEADIDSFSIGFIPEGNCNWASEVSTTLPSSSSSGDPFSSNLQPLDLNISHSSSDHSQNIQTSSSADLHTISGTIYTTSDSFHNIKTEATSLGEINQMWETTVALSGVPTSLNSIKTEPMLSSSSQGEIFTTSTSGLNAIYTETFTIPSHDALGHSIISISGNGAQIINGTDIDFSKLQAGGFTVSAQHLLDHQETLTTTFQPGACIKSHIQWVEDPSLPEGWKTRQHYREGQLSKVDTYYMAPDGAQFRSKWKVVEYMESSGAYCQEDIDWVRTSITTPKPDSSSVTIIKERSDKLKREWKEDDPTVPQGWKVAWTTTSDNRAKIAFMSPDKKIFHSRKSALQHMLAAGTYEQLDIERMTKGLNVLLNVGDEWKEGDKSLPEGWKIRSHQWWCQKRNSHRIHYEFLSPQNEFFKSRKAVVEHMTHEGMYSQEQIEMVRLQTTPAGADKAGKKKPVLPPRQDNSPCNPLIGWKTGNSTLPPGWKIKRHEYANQTVYFYMSPKGDIIKSRRGVIDYMFDDGGYEEKDFGIVIGGAKQRKAALQELFENKTNKKNRKMKKKGGKTMPSEDPDITELDLADSDDNLGEEAEDPKKAAMKKPPKPDKEQIQPTRRSGRVALKIKEKRKHDSDDEEEEEDMADGRRRAEDETGVNRRKRGKLFKSSTLDLNDEDVKVEEEDTEDRDMLKEEYNDEEDKEDLLEDSIQYLDSQDSVSLGDIMVEDSEIQNLQRIEEITPKQEEEEEEEEEDMEEEEEGCVDMSGVEYSEECVRVEGGASLLDGASLVNYTNSNTEHSAHSLVVNVITDIVSTISE